MLMPPPVTCKTTPLFSTEFQILLLNPLLGISVFG